MKKIIMAWMTLSGTLLFAQHNLSYRHNLPRAGEVIVKQQVQFKDPGRSGEHVVWDFGKLEPINPAYRLVYSEPHMRRDSVYVLGQDTFPANAYDNKNLLIGREHQTLYFYRIQNNVLYCTGYTNQRDQMHHIEPLPVLFFPMQFGQKFTTLTRSEDMFSSRVLISTHGSMGIEADAHGMIVLPSGDTLKHVLRVHSQQIILADSIPAMDSIHVDTRIESFKWYAAGYRYPVFETIQTTHRQDTIEDIFETAFFFPPQEQSTTLGEDYINQVLLDSLRNNANTLNPWEELNFNVFPNPVRQYMQVELYLPQPVQNLRIHLRDPMGIVWADNNLGACPAGISSFTIPTGSLPVNNYVLDFWLDDYLVHGSILMKR